MGKAMRWVGPVMVLVLAGWVRAERPETLPTSADETRRAFLQIIDRPKVDPAFEQQEQPAEAGMAHFHFTYASEAGQRVPGILLEKSDLVDGKTPRPVVIVMHGTGQKKESELGYLKRLAEKGFVAIAIDGRYHGERGTQADYNAAIAKAYSGGGAHPLYYDTVWDILRLVDVLQRRPGIDPKRIGLMGISKGGIETWLASAADPRTAAAVPCIGVQSFEWGLEHDGWHARIGTVQKGFTAAATSEGIEKPDAAFVRKFYDRVIPGIHDRFDGPAMIPLVAPRPLLVISGEKDPNNPLPGLQLCEAAGKAAYEKAGAAAKFKVLVEANTGHSVTPAAQTAAVEWFVKWLGGSGE